MPSFREIRSARSTGALFLAWTYHWGRCRLLAGDFTTKPVPRRSMCLVIPLNHKLIMCLFRHCRTGELSLVPFSYAPKGVAGARSGGNSENRMQPSFNRWNEPQMPLATPATRVSHSLVPRTKPLNNKLKKANREREKHQRIPEKRVAITVSHNTMPGGSCMVAPPAYVNDKSGVCFC